MIAINRYLEKKKQRKMEPYDRHWGDYRCEEK
jgi:hypothetical protein